MWIRVGSFGGHGAACLWTRVGHCRGSSMRAGSVADKVILFIFIFLHFEGEAWVGWPRPNGSRSVLLLDKTTDQIRIEFGSATGFKSVRVLP